MKNIPIVDFFLRAGICGTLIFSLLTFTQFLGRNAFAAKINFKYALISIILTFSSGMIIMFSSAFSWSFDVDSFLLSLFLPVLLAIVINSKRGAADPLNPKVLKPIFAEWKKPDPTKHPCELRRDRTESFINAGIYVLILFFLSRTDFVGHDALMWGLAMIGIVHLLFYGKYGADCPYCDYSLQNVPIHISAFNCPVCRQRIIQNGNRLDRPRGRRAG
ncbi:hypothetical protein [Saccharibacillus alkalitolerans]|uniref:Uncharacterized protein n=1 Tax=Saccharibacillus alkalitolerans TaxID=2705290 RepID=A0ABX0F7W9_9BACL|nr:hypothetical protein [Saccharibacillus alkalitolerans]NGZ77048.1 hypothetical protein [Saccharibacillus alkalitolerans]